MGADPLVVFAAGSRWAAKPTESPLVLTTLPAASTASVSVEPTGTRSQSLASREPLRAPGAASSSRGARPRVVAVASRGGHAT